MPDMFLFVVGMVIASIGLLLITARVMAYIKCTVPIHATVVKLEKEYTHFRGVRYTHYRPVVGYVVDGKEYTEKAHFRTLREMKYPIGSKMEICYNSGKPEEMRFVGHFFPLPTGLVFLFIGAALIWCYFL